MVKKQKTLAQDEDKQAASAAQPSAYQIWQAGLGAFVKAHEEGGRVFNLLVQENSERQKRSDATPEQGVSGPIGAATNVTNATNASDATNVCDGVSEHAAGASDKLEQAFEERVACALGSLGVPTHEDIATLTRQIEQLHQLVAELSGRTAPPARSTPNGAVQPAAQPIAGKAARKPAVKAVLAAPKTVASPAAKAAPRQPVARKACIRKAGAAPATED